MNFNRINLFYLKYDICVRCKRFDTILVGALLPRFKFIFFCNQNHTDAYEFSNFNSYEKWSEFLHKNQIHNIIYQKHYQEGVLTQISFGTFWEIYNSTFNDKNRLIHPIWREMERSKSDWYEKDTTSIEYQIISFMDEHRLHSFADLPFDVHLQ